MEQPEIYREEQYAKVVSSMQPVYGQTKGLGNKTIAKAVTEALTIRQMEREYLPAGLREKYGLAEINYAPFSGKPGRTDVFPETSCV